MDTHLLNSIQSTNDLKVPKKSNICGTKQVHCTKSNIQLPLSFTTPTSSIGHSQYPFEIMNAPPPFWLHLSSLYKDEVGLVGLGRLVWARCGGGGRGAAVVGAVRRWQARCGGGGRWRARCGGGGRVGGRNWAVPKHDFDLHL